MNFQEAYDHAFHVYIPSQIPTNVQNLIDHPKASTSSFNSSSFWIMMSALKTFVATFGSLPCMGSVPDMTSTTENYIALQTVYAEKAAEDVTKFTSIIQDILKRFELSIE